MQSDEISTIELPASQQFDAWMGWFGGAYDVAPHDPLSNGFIAQSRNWLASGIMLSHVQAPAIRVTRSTAHIRRDQLDHWVIAIGRRTTSLVRSDDPTMTVPGGTPIVLSLADEMISDRTADRRLQLYLSRDRFPELAPVLDQLRGKPLNNTLGGLLGDYLNMIWRLLPDVTPDDVPRLNNAIGAMVGACLAPERGIPDSASRQIDFVQLERVRRVIKANLRSPALGPRLLCQQLSLSRSTLYRLVANEGGLARYIQRQRLLEAYAILADPAADRPIADIAEQLCFTDKSGFSRAFRREFGSSPSDLRASSKAAAETGISAPGPGRASRDLRSALRSI